VEPSRLGVGVLERDILGSGATSLPGEGVAETTLVGGGDGGLLAEVLGWTPLAGFPNPSPLVAVKTAPEEGLLDPQPMSSQISVDNVDDTPI